MPDILTIKKKNVAQPVPQFAGLALPRCLGPLSKPNAKSVAEYHKSAIAFDKRLAELNDRFSAMMEQSPDLTLTKIAEIGEELRTEKRKVCEELVVLLWRRFQILPGLVEDFAQAAKAAKQNHEKGFLLAAKRFAEQGVTSESMRAGGYGEAGEIQFRRRLDQEVEVLKTIVPMRDSEAGLRAVLAHAGSAPRRFEVKWPEPTGEFGEHVFGIARLGQGDGSETKSNVITLMIELGFSNSILPERHMRTVDALAEKLNPAGGFARPIQDCLHMRSKGFQQVRAQVESLPKTQEIVRLFQTIDNNQPQEKAPQPKKVLLKF